MGKEGRGEKGGMKRKRTKGERKEEGKGDEPPS